MSSRNNLIIDNFHKNATETLKQMRNVKEFSDVTLISEDQIMFQSHKVVLASTRRFFRKIINRINHPVIYLRGVKSQLLASMLEVIYDGQTKVNKNDCSSFIRLLEYYQVYEQDIHQTKYEETHTKLANIQTSGIFGLRASEKINTPVLMIIPKMTAIHTSSMENVQTQAAEVDTEMSVITGEKACVKEKTTMHIFILI